MRILILSIVALSAIVASAFFLGANSSDGPELTTANVLNTSGEKPWIEVLSGKVFEFDKNGKLIKELKTGDSLEEERTIDAGTGTLANIYFGNGSVLKIDSETKIKIVKGEFQKTSGKLSVKIWLVVGRVYSQIKSLATIDSEWQVETPNTVATVRGTAFGVEFSKGKSMVIVTQNKVEVSAKDPATNQIIESSKTTAKENEFIVVDEKDIPKIKAEKRTLKIEKAGEEILQRTWIKRELEEEKNSVDQVKVEEQRTIENLKQTEQNTQPIQIKNVELKITGRIPLEKIFEGESIKFEAILILNDGSEKTVTTETKWQVLGGIGTMEKNGAFLAKLDGSVSELGSAFGNVVAIWKDSATGKEFLGKTPIFKVEARAIEQEIDNLLEPRG